VLHETIVEGQIHGGVVQGIGQVLGEHVIYGDDGQLITASFMDYPMPRAADVPQLSVHHHVVPCTTNPLGAKGAALSLAFLPGWAEQPHATEQPDSGLLIGAISVLGWLSP
jgi:Molybdopterin cofactor-binding domain